MSDSTGVTTCASTTPSSAAARSCTTSSATRRRRAKRSAGSRRCRSTSSYGCWSMPTLRSCAAPASAPTRPRIPRVAEMLDEADVDALVTRLRAELDLTAQGSTDRPLWEPARIEAGRLAPVSGDRNFYRRPGALGTLRYYATAAPKTVMRKLVRWYVEPIAAEQRAFNGAVLRLIDDVTSWTASAAHAATEHTDALSERLDRLEQAVAARAGEGNRLEDRLLRLERRPAPDTVPTDNVPGTAGPAAAGPLAAPFDYFAFEGRMRENRDEIRRRQASYVDDFRDAAPVLDVGCGRGEFLDLLREAGIEARGVDADADMAAFSRGEGLDVEHGDALAYLNGMAERSLGGIFAAHVVEHMPPPGLVRFLELAASRLRPGRLLVPGAP